MLYIFGNNRYVCVCVMQVLSDFSHMKNCNVYLSSVSKNESRVKNFNNKVPIWWVAGCMLTVLHRLMAKHLRCHMLEFAMCRMTIVTKFVLYYVKWYACWKDKGNYFSESRLKSPCHLQNNVWFGLPHNIAVGHISFTNARITTNIFLDIGLSSCRE